MKRMSEPKQRLPNCVVNAHLAEVKLGTATAKHKMAQAAPLISQLVDELPELAPQAAPLQAKMEAFFSRKSAK